MTDTENFDFTPAWDFYDLEEDPHENHNLYNDPKYAPITLTLGHPVQLVYCMQNESFGMSFMRELLSSGNKDKFFYGKRRISARKTVCFS